MEIIGFLGKNLLELPCRHHIFELVLEGVFVEVMGPSSGPDVLLFKRFQQEWPNIDTAKYIISEDSLPAEYVIAPETKQEILSFAEAKISVNTVKIPCVDETLTGINQTTFAVCRRDSRVTTTWSCWSLRLFFLGKLLQEESSLGAPGRCTTLGG